MLLPFPSRSQWSEQSPPLPKAWRGWAISTYSHSLLALARRICRRAPFPLLRVAGFRNVSHPLTTQTERVWLRAKNRSHESKLLLAQMNRSEFLFDSCSSGPKVTLIHDSYFLALIQALSVCVVRGCENLRNPTLR